jgi:two-component system nitrogen regulation response regulator GlnG/two-component system response regulator HydG
LIARILGTFDDRPTIDALSHRPLGSSGAAAEQVALVIAWCRDAPERAGEVTFFESGPQILGRGGTPIEETAPARVHFSRQRLDDMVRGRSLRSQRISREQLRLEADAEFRALHVQSIGRCPLLVNGRPASAADVGPGDTLQLQNELVLLVAKRPRGLLSTTKLAYPDFPFGQADPFGIVGESPGSWRLREALRFAAAVDEHALVRGESGTGKELAVRAIHALSTRAGRPLVARNAATVPEGIVDAELFGNLKNYPNPGVPERTGLIGEADGSTLFLDEIGELPVHVQAHLLRVLDRDGEYQRLGDPKTRRADLRLIAATNRAVDALKHDLAARLTLRLEVPSLAERREDIPLIAMHLLSEIAAHNAELAERFFETPAGGGRRMPRLDPNLVEALVRHAYTTHTRELRSLLWCALTESTGDRLEITAGVARGLGRESAEPRARLAPMPTIAIEPSSSAGTEPPRPLYESATREQIEAALAKHQGNVANAAVELGFKNRYVLYRLMKKLDIAGGAD